MHRFLYLFGISALMKSYWGIVRDVIWKADVLLLILDARQPFDTINKEIITRAKDENKPLIYVATKSDLVTESVLKNSKQKLSPLVMVSAKTGQGIGTLYDEIFKVARKPGKEKDKGIIKVGVLGYPNVGKSSLINAMKGAKVTKTSGMSGYTKFSQKIKLDQRIIIMDTPGVLPDDRKNFLKSAMLGSLDYTHIREPVVVAIALMQKYPGKFEKFYDSKMDDDLEQVIDDLAVKRNLFLRGKVPDRIRMARIILVDWHKGNIKI
jgi:ribosome biogenesis GTPase A